MKELNGVASTDAAPCMPTEGEANALGNTTNTGVTMDSESQNVQVSINSNSNNLNETTTTQTHTHVHETSSQSSASMDGINTPLTNSPSSAPPSTTSPPTTGTSPIPVAICGIALRLPSGSDSPSSALTTTASFYDFLTAKQDARSVLPSSRFSSPGYFTPHPNKPNTVNTEHGYYLPSHLLSSFDPSLYNYTPSEISHLDPAHRLALQVVRECLTSAGVVLSSLTTAQKYRIGVYAGVFSDDWQDLHRRDTQFYHPYHLLGSKDFALSNRVSYEYDLRGPSMTIKTACSSAGVALYEAVKAIQRGEIDSAVVTGVNLIMAPGMSVAMTLQGTLSPEGSCNTFDIKADGYARGEACTAVYIKRADLAVEERNPVRAVIRGCASNADGRTKGLSVPSADAHEECIRMAYRNAGLEAEMGLTCVFEAHGTGTKVGDPIEARAIAACFGGRRDRAVYMGAVKPNMGHSEGAATLTSIIKAVVALENRVIIPNIKFETPNPEIPWEEGNLVVPTEPLPWPVDCPERYSVNSYGIGGSNAHFVIDSAASFGLGLPRSIPRALLTYELTPLTLPRKRPSLLVFSAGHPKSLRTMAQQNHEYLTQHSEQGLEDVAYTLAERRERFKYRGFSVISGASSIEKGAVDVAPVTSQGLEKVAFVFTGQGAQWANMGRDLMIDYPSFLGTIRDLDDVLHSLDPAFAPSWSIEQILSSTSPDDGLLLSQAEYSQPICTAIQIGLVDLLASFGVKPSAVVGHSSGEIAAAYAAGSLSKRDAIIAAFFRGWVCKDYSTADNNRPKGGMAAIGLSKAAVMPFLADSVTGGKVTIACENSGHSVTLSGDVEELESVMARIKEAREGVLVRKLKVEMAYHSDHMRLVGEQYHALIAAYIQPPSPPTVPFLSSVHGGKVITDAADLGPKYWQQNLEQPVLFHSAVKALLKSTPSSSPLIHLEVGPHSTLQGPLRQIYKETSSHTQQYIGTLTRDKNDTTSFLTAIGQLFTIGYPIQLPSSPFHQPKVVPNLPPYPWNNDNHYWHTTRAIQNWRFRRHLPHDLLGVRTIDSSDLTPTWRNAELLVADVPWLRDHMVGNDIIFPGTGYVAMAGEAIYQLLCDKLSASASSELSDPPKRDYTVKEVTLHQALLLNDETPAEIITTLKPQRITTSLDSAEWYEFTIVSYKPNNAHLGMESVASGTWNKHCTGLVRSAGDFKRRPYQTRKAIPASLPRRVSSTRWYTTMAHIGLNYGPRFTGLQDISSDVINYSTGKPRTGNAAIAMTAKITDNVGEPSESSYALHPSTLDLILQSWTVASVQGQYRKFTQLALPTFIQEWYIGDLSGSESSQRSMQIKTNATGRNGVVGESFGVLPASSNNENQNELVYFLHGFKATPMDSISTSSASTTALDSQDSKQEDEIETPSQMALQLHWRPSIDFIPSPASLTRPKYDITDELTLSERLFVLCALESLPLISTISDSEITQPHFLAYRNWLHNQLDRITAPEYPLVHDSITLSQLDSPARQSMISSLLQQSKSSAVSKICTAIHRTFTNLPAIFTNKVDFLDLLIHDGTLAGIYDWMNAIWDYSQFFTLLGHSTPQMRILEIGAGTGGLTSRILPLLHSSASATKERLYLSYTFTDVSSGFFPAAKKRFAEYEGVEYKVLDISSDPLSQGFDSNDTYDLIIASNVLHATPDLNQTLRNVRKLVHPTRGRMFLQELSPVTQGMVYIMGLFSGWWLGEKDGRGDKPYIEVDEWGSRLKETGWEGVGSVAFDNDRGMHINANMVIQPAKQAQVAPTDALGATEMSRVSLLLSRAQNYTEGATGKFVDRVESVLKEKGYAVERYIWAHETSPPADQDLISFVDLDGPLLHNPSDQDWNLFLKTIKSLQLASTVWLTPPVQVDARDPHAGLVLGVLRTIRSERDPQLATLELSEWESHEAATAVEDILKRVRDTKEDVGESDLAPDLEYAWHDGSIQVSRFHWVPVPEALKDTANAMGPPDTKALEIGKQGLLQSLHWVGQSLPPLPEDHVQIEMKAVGLNFRDVLIAVGVLSRNLFSTDDVYPLGLEGAGVVTKVGSKVTHLRVGDRVMTLGTNPNLVTQVQRPAEFTIRIDDGLSFVDAATMPGVYLTLLMALVDRARLRKGQSILIHAAAGGIGVAAIHLCRWIGAEIYCTAGTDEKVKFLVDEMGVPRDHIFHSRDTSFRDDILEITDGVGVDVALNSTSGEMLHATWDCLASHGVMVEIGKRDMIGRGQLAMDKFEDNRTFIGVDLWRYALNDVPEVGRLLRWANQLYLEGHIHPIRPVNLFPAAQIQDAFRFMQQGQHMGKIVITFPGENRPVDGNGLQWTRAIPKPSFQNDKAYLLIGGMGGLGQSIATWMVDHGARHLIFLSRSAGKSDDDRAFIQELRLSGCAVQTWSGDVSDPDVVKRTIESSPRPIAGVMQMAMILRDMGTMDMDLATYQAVIKPRVEGTWNLHNLLPDQGKNLDFFVLFSSVCGIVGNYGQANYAASNTFMDAFVQYRRARGLPASVIDIGAVDEVGYISRTPAARENMLASAGKLITEQAFLDCLQLTIARSALSSQGTPLASAGDQYAGYTNPSQVTQALECRLPIMHPENAIIWKRDPRWAIYRNIEKTSSDGAAAGGESVSGGKLKTFLMSIRSEPGQLETPAAAEFLASEIRNRVSTFLMRGEIQDDGNEESRLNVGLTLSEAGVDSLVAIELRNWWKQNLGVEVSVLELMNGGSMRRLGDLAVSRLKARFIQVGR
ncbi:polyketide synthase [Naviculisporaceae sp. PSN 640]